MPFLFPLQMVFLANADENVDIDKRYLAALAKNGRLPKFASAQKKDQLQEETVQSSEKEDAEEEFSKNALLEDKRHIGAFLKLHGKPNFMRTDSYADDSNRDDKRNIASMARLGRLNSVRFARLQPYSVGGKRMGSEEASNNDEDNAINLFEDPDCLETEDNTNNGGNDRPMWMQKKRYVAALARSGRLPIWHSQRMWWGGKRDDSRPYYSLPKYEDAAENSLDDMPFIASKNKRCKKVYDSQKRNIASLARNGKLPFRPNA